jgi:hypothetical protein
MSSDAIIRQIDADLAKLAGRVERLERVESPMTGGSLHPPVTLAPSADAIMDIAAQVLSLDTQTANTVLAGPTSGAAAAPDFRALVFADMPVLPYIAKIADYTATAADYTIAVTCSVVDITITLPAAATCAGRIYNIKKMDATAFHVIIDGNGAETIDGDATVTITGQYDNVPIQSTGAAWIIL